MSDRALLNDHRFMNDEMSLIEFNEWLKENGVPDDAIIRYAGCGSHLIEFEWNIQEGPEVIENRMPAKLDDDEYWIKQNE